MKTIVMTICICLCAGVASYAQTKAPAAVENAFKQKFPKATDVSWDKENATEYEAEFKIGAQKYAANFANDGKWLETESTITFSQLPAKVQAAYQASKKDVQPKAVSHINNAKGETKYEIEFKQGTKTVEWFYDANGNKVKE